MPRYRVTFEIFSPNELLDDATERVAAAIVARLEVANRVLRPRDGKVRVSRIYEPREELEVLQQHVAADHGAGRDWNSPQGCDCAVCRMFREGGTTVGGTQIIIGAFGGLRK